MKTRKLLILLLIIVLLVVYTTLGMDYVKQWRKHEALASEIAEATRALAQIPAPPADLEPRLAAARVSLDTVRNSFPGKLNSTRIINAILNLADDAGVKAVPLVTQPWTTEDIGDHGYAVFRLNVAVTGTFTQLVSFLSKLESGELPTLIIEHTSVTRLTETSEGKTISEGIPVNARLDLVIYTQPATIE